MQPQHHPPWSKQGVQNLTHSPASPQASITPAPHYPPSASAPLWQEAPVPQVNSNVSDQPLIRRDIPPLSACLPPPPLLANRLPTDWPSRTGREPQPLWRHQGFYSAFKRKWNLENFKTCNKYSEKKVENCLEAPVKGLPVMSAHMVPTFERMVNVSHTHTHTLWRTYLV